MARCSVAGEKFAAFVFSPCVGLIVGSDVDDACLKDNLTFVELLRPFSQLTKDVTLRDSNNLLHTLCNLRINFLDASTPPPTAHRSRSHLREAVSTCAFDHSIAKSTYSNGNLFIQIPNSTPWFEAWRHTFIKSLWPSSHEFLGHNLGCVFVLSTGHPDPVQGFKDLTQHQTEQQHHRPGSFPLWFSSDVIKFYLLVHDASSKVHQNRAEELYTQVCAAFGSASCYLLPIFTMDVSSAIDSACSLSNGNAIMVESGGNPGARHLSPTQPTTTNEDGDPRHQDTVNNPVTLDGGSGVNSSLESADPWLNHVLPHGFYCRPLSAVASPVENGHHIDVNPHRSVKRQSVIGIDPLVDCDNLDHTDEQTDVKQKAASVQLLQQRHQRLHGRRISQIDRDRIRAFVHEFVIRSLLPWVEKTMRSLNDQIAHRLRLTRSFFSATKKLFYSAVGGGGNTSSTSLSATSPPTLVPPGGAQLPPTNKSTTSSLPHSSSSNTLLPPSGSAAASTLCSVLPSSGLIGRTTTNDAGSGLPTVHSAIQMSNYGKTAEVVYTPEAPELQMRRLADLAFLFQQYELAHQTYVVLKRDFQNDSAWLHCAGAQEMAAFAVYLQGSTSQRQYPHHYVDSAISIYLHTCHSAELALRATLLNAEALCSRGLYAEAAVNLLRLTSEEDDLTSAVLIEQTAHCVLHLRRPLLRKFAFRMALAAHRYSRAKMPHLTIRCYKMAYPIYRSRGWSLIEDHVNYNVGRQAFLTQDLSLAVSSLRKTLSANSRQSEDRQNVLLREYLLVLKAYLSSQSSCGTLQSIGQGSVRSLPEFPFLIVRMNKLKVMLGRPIRSRDDLGIQARGFHFSDEDDVNYDESTDDDCSKDVVDERTELYCQHRNAADIPTSSNNLVERQHRNKLPDWMEGTDVSDDSMDSEEEDSNTIGLPGTNSDRLLNPMLSAGVQSSKCNYNNRRALASASSVSNEQITYRLERFIQSSSVSKRSVRQSSRGSFSSSSRTTTKGSSFGKNRLITLATKSSARRQRTFVPCWEHLTVQLPLFNPMRIPLVLTNLNLLWALKLPSPLNNTNSGSLKYFPNQVISNEWISLDPPSTNYDKPENREDLEAMMTCCQQAVSTETITEFIMLPDEEKTLELGLFPRQPGELQITGLSFDWHHWLPTAGGSGLNQQSSAPDQPDTTATNPFFQPQSLTPVGSQETISYNGETHGDRYSVRGKVALLSDTDQRQDNRINWVVADPFPLLEVVFSTFPTRLLQGQIHCLDLSLINVGHSKALTSIQLASTWPGFVSFASEDSAVSFPYRKDNVESPLETEFVYHPMNGILEVPIQRNKEKAGNSFLDAGDKVVIPMWLRAPHLTDIRQRHTRRFRHSLRLSRRLASTEADVTGTQTASGPEPVSPGMTSVNSPLTWEQRTVHLVFRYETVKLNHKYPTLNYRFIRHHTNIDLYPSVQLEAVATRGPVPPPGEEVGNLLISLRIRNVSVPPLKTSFSLLQISCASRYWTLAPVNSFFGTKSVQIGPGEVTSLFLTATSRRSLAVAGRRFSTVVLSQDGDQNCNSFHIPVHKSPWFDFYRRSGTQWNRRYVRSEGEWSTGSAPRSHNIPVDIALIVVWKALPEGSTNLQLDTLGQSHVTIKQLDRIMCMPPKNDMTLAVQRLIPSPLSETPRLPTVVTEYLNSLVQLRFSHPKVVIHDFPSARFTGNIPASLRSPLAIHSPTPTNSSLLANSISWDGKVPSASKMDDLSSCGNRVSPSLAIIPLQLDLYNVSSRYVVVLLKRNEPTTLHHENLGGLSENTSKQLPHLQWIGFTSRWLRLAPGTSTRLDGLFVAAPQPGVYDISRSIVALAGPTDAASEQLTLQSTAPPSVVIIELPSRKTPSFLDVTAKIS